MSTMAKTFTRTGRYSYADVFHDVYVVHHVILLLFVLNKFDSNCLAHALFIVPTHTHHDCTAQTPWGAPDAAAAATAAPPLARST
jgi:hypothetical protein